MSLYSSTISEILPFVPLELHNKTVDIFNRIPGTLLKFFDPKVIAKKAEYGEHKFLDVKSLGNNDHIDCLDLQKDSSDAMIKRSYTQDVAQRSHSLRLKSSSRSAVEKETTYNSDLWCTGHGYEHNKEWNSLRSRLRETITKMFRDRHITEISPGKLAREIATKCLEQSPSWSKQHQNSSAIVRFNNTYITDEPLVKMSVHAYVYAHLICEYETSFMFRSQYKTTYDLTIDLNGISLDPIKLSQFCRLIAENSVSDSVKIIEGNTILTWDDLNGTHSNRSSDKKFALTWDDL